ncbi:MAG: tetratricopeptide repeat protein, partial [Methyloligellaceae bacterium]
MWCLKFRSLTSLLLISCIFLVVQQNNSTAQNKVLNALNRQAMKLYRSGSFAAAILFAQQSAEQTKKTFGANHLNYATAIDNLANIYRLQGRYVEAEPLLKRALAIREKTLRNDHPDIAASFNSLASLYLSDGRYWKAEPLFKRTFTLWEKAFGGDDPRVGTTLNNLASLYRSQGRYANAERLYKRALAIVRKTHGNDHPNVGISLDNLAGLYKAQKRYDEAEPLSRRALAIVEKALDEDHPSVGISLDNLAGLYVAQKRYAEAEVLSRRALAIFEKVLGKDHPSMGVSLSNLARQYRRQGRYAEAEPLSRRALAIAEKALGKDHPSVGKSLSNLAFVLYGQKKWAQAYGYLKESTQLYARRARRVGHATLTGQTRTSAQRQHHSFKVLVKAAYRVAQEDDKKEASFARQTFQHLQWTGGAGAAAALSQMAVRFGAGDDKLAQRVRERQDLKGQWQRLDNTLIAAKSQSSSKRNKAFEKTLNSRLAMIDKRISEIDKIFKKDFPDYAALANPEPLSVKQVQSHLGEDEALIYIVDTPKWENTPEESFVWVVTKTNIKWVRSGLGATALESMVKSLRCGLDSVGWRDAKKAAECTKLLRTDYSRSSYEKRQPLPFEVSLAHKLYDGLFGQIEKEIQGKKLLLVPAGPLTSLPFQILVTEKPKSATGYDQVTWLINRHDLTVLPSVASLNALRRISSPSRAAEPYFGVGNPLLLGPSGKDTSASKRTACHITAKPKPLIMANVKAPGTIARYFLGGLADVNTLRRQTPLPETADELCAVAKLLGAKSDAIHLGTKATEANLKTLSQRGDLKRAKVIHFATHGLLAGETETLIRSSAEPSLMLTPPDKATRVDDGLLTASEITQLKLDADWVILSACNTAGGETPGAEAMSGLAKAFFYAGARALLVSHWYVNSYATVALITGSFEALSKNPKLGRAGALRVAMRDLINSKRYSHPEYWAPFIV